MNHLVVAIVAGIGVGLVLGLLGGGGAIITVPILTYGLAMTPQAATTASLVIVGASSLVASLSHRAAGNVRFGQGLTFGAIGTIGTTLGSLAAARVEPRTAMLTFAVLLTVVGVLMWRGADRPQPDSSSANPVTRFTPVFHADWQALGRVAAAALGVGLLTGFFGVGGGFAIVPALVMLLGFPMPVAVGTSLVVIALNSASAFAARWASGVVLDWAVVGLFTAAAMAGSLLGARWSARIPPRLLRRAFAGVLLLVATYVAVRTLLG